MSNLEHFNDRDFDQTRAERIRGRVLRRLRAHGVRTHWSDAKRLAPTIRASDITRWFNHRFGDDWHACLRGTSPKRRLLKQLIWLIEVRDGYRNKRDVYTVTRINAAIWKTVMTMKDI